jgi:hypothetical protein
MACKFECEFSSKLDILFKWPVTLFYIKNVKMTENEIDHFKIFLQK